MAFVPILLTDMSKLGFLRYLLGSAPHILTAKGKLLLAGVNISLIAEIHGSTARSSVE